MKVVERVALGLAAASLLAVVVTAGVLFASARRSAGDSRPADPSYTIGQRIDVPAAVYNTAAYTVVLFARSNCPACQRVKPWLSDLRTRVEQEGSTRFVMMATGAQLEEEVQYAKEIGLTPDHVIPLAPGPLQARHVPTFVLVDRQGTVLHLLEGPRDMAGPENIEAIITLVQNR